MNLKLFWVVCLSILFFIFAVAGQERADGQTIPERLPSHMFGEGQFDHQSSQFANFSDSMEWLWAAFTVLMCA